MIESVCLYITASKLCSLHLRQTSNSRCPMSFCTALMVSLSCLAIAWPRNDSTLKLLVLVGNMMKETTVTSLFAFYTAQQYRLPVRTDPCPRRQSDG